MDSAFLIWGSILLTMRITHQAENVALSGAVVQSSLWDPTYPPKLTIDGKLNSHYFHKSCTSTVFEANPWWRLDLKRPYYISSIEVLRRSDCCISELDGAELRIGNSLDNNGNNNPRCAVIYVISGVLMAFSCSQMRGQYINIFLPGERRRLQLCEVRVYTTTHIKGANVAMSGVTFHSSLLLEEPWGPSSLVIDGKPYSNYNHKSCFSTNFEANPWWRLDMRGPYLVNAIEVVRKMDSDELQGAEIRIGDSLENNGNNNPRCAVISISNDVTMAFNCKLRGRYVNIFLPGEGRILQLCEVKVYATALVSGANVASRGVATQSAESAYNETAPHLATDYRSNRNSSKTCASVSRQDNPWWQLDMRSLYYITAVSIVSAVDNSSEELNLAEVHIGARDDTNNPRCAVIAVAEGQHKYTYQCGKMLGRFVQVILPGKQKILTLCEVIVYGTILDPSKIYALRINVFGLLIIEENVALRGVAFQSSVGHPAGPASRVIDGRYSTLSTTENKPGQWVTVDLLVPYAVTFIQLAYKKVCCYNETVKVDNTSCWTLTPNSEHLLTLDCGRTIGRYVTVSHQDVPLSLSEVEIYSTQISPANTVPQLPKPHDYCPYSSCSRDYVLVHNENRTWFDAQAYCREKYTDLATISNAQEMNRAFEITGKHFNDFWIGLYKDVLTWRWLQPDQDYLGDVGKDLTSIQRCGGIEHTGPSKNLDCDLLNYFFCFDGTGSAPTTKILVETPMKWFDARNYCRTHHTELLTIKSQNDSQEIQSMLQPGKLAWIGKFGDLWKWSDGSYSSFRYRWQGELASSGEGPLCAHVYNGKFSMRSCSAKSMFLCYYRRKQSLVRISTNIDLSDPVIQQQFLSQLEAKLRTKGIKDIKISWRSYKQHKIQHETQHNTSWGPGSCHKQKV